MFKPKLPQQEQGFTLVEVLVAILITTVFVATTMQAMVIAAVFKARAKQYSEATNWIQEDLESVRQQASVLGYTTLSSAPTIANPSSISVSSSNGFQVGNRLQIGTINDTLYTIANTYTPGSTTIPVTPALTAAQISATPTGTSVSVVATGSTNNTLCYATAQNNGFGNILSANLPTAASNGTRTIAGGTYTLTRTPAVRDTPPYEVLEITYSVAKSNEPAVAKMNSEVIPNAAFQCPGY